jgi:uncharacterized SAM-binding protein YcdF (DUF218 family)
MFYTIAKIVGFVAIASNATLLLGLFGLALSLSWDRLRRTGRVLMGAALILFGLFGLSPLGNAMILPLEARFPPATLLDDTEIAGIIVLGGAVDTHVSAGRGQTALTDSAERLTAVAGLSRRFPAAGIIYSGGVSAVSSALWGDIPEADAASALFTSFGIPKDRMVFENKSRDTYENAQFTRDLLHPTPGQHYLLVTSAYHMPRAMALFRKAGFDVLAYPVNYRTAGPRDLIRPFYALNDGLRQSNIATREWIGLASYWLSGRIDSIFPTP